MGEPTGFTFEQRKSGEVVIRHNGKLATKLRGDAARKFLRDIAHHPAQQVMARATGNYKRGNERRH
jgi:hypothetical protein